MSIYAGLEKINPTRKCSFYISEKNLCNIHWEAITACRYTCGTIIDSPSVIYIGEF